MRTQRKSAAKTQISFRKGCADRFLQAQFRIMKAKRSLPLLIIALLVAASSINAQQSATRTNEWPQFRGPNGSGVADGFALPAEFNATKNLVWKTPVPFARSSPVVT